MLMGGVRVGDLVPSTLLYGEGRVRKPTIIKNQV